MRRWPRSWAMALCRWRRRWVRAGLNHAKSCPFWGKAIANRHFWVRAEIAEQAERTGVFLHEVARENGLRLKCIGRSGGRQDFGLLRRISEENWTALHCPAFRIGKQSEHGICWQSARLGTSDRSRQDPGRINPARMRCGNQCRAGFSGSPLYRVITTRQSGRLVPEEDSNLRDKSL
jgi:hypothetical protein